MSEFAQPPVKIAEGKTKIIWDLPGTGEVMIESKDDITAGDGKRRDRFEGKGVLSTKITSNCFRLLERAGIPTHFVAQEGERTFRAKQVAMFPIELAARRIAFGSYLKRNPATEPRTRFEDLTFEMFSKEDPLNDPILIYDFEAGTVSRYKAKAPISPETLVDTMPIDDSPFALSLEQRDILARLTKDTFELLEAAWADQDVTLVDLKIECGVTADGKIVVADVIDNESSRIWLGGDPGRMVDKQLFRDGRSLAEVADSYAWVAQATEAFNPEAN